MADKIDVQLPVQFEDFYLLSFGKINANPLYYGANYIWPIGYKSCWHEKVTGSLFMFEVSNNGQGGPLFTITRSSCSKSLIPCGQTVLCHADLDEYDNAITELPQVDPEGSNDVAYEDLIGDLCFEGSSPSSTWKMLLEKIAYIYDEIINGNGGVPCYCRHTEDLNFLSSLYCTRQVNKDLKNFLSSQHYVNVPTVIHGDNESRDFSKLLINWLKQYQFGLDIGFVQEFIEHLHGVNECSGYILSKDRLFDFSLSITNKRIKIKEVETFPLGSLVSSRLSSHAIDDLLQVHEFLCRFREVLEVEEDCLSYEDLENELLSPWPVTYGFGGRVFSEKEEMSLNKCKVDKLTSVHMALLPRLVTKLLRKVAKAFSITSDVEDTKKSKGNMVKLEMFPINQVTWPEVARRYILSCLLMGGQVNSLETAVGNNIKLIRCLQGDDGIFSGSPSGVAGADVDTELLGRVVEKVFGKMKRERSIIFTRTKVNNSDNCGLNTEFSIPEWAKVLDPVRTLPTNVGSRIRNCVRESLNKNPPEWAKKLLEASISKDVYKGNASGPTKRAVINVLKNVSDGPQPSLPPPSRDEIKNSKMLSDTVMKKCRMILRQVAGCDENIFCSDLVGRNFNCDDNYLKIVFGPVLIRPIDLRVIDLRLVHGAYCGSHEAFLEDVREVWINVRRTYKYKTTVIELVYQMSSDFNMRYEKEVVTILRIFYEDYMNRKPIEEIEKELEEILNSTEIPKAPWEEGICKICGINRDDGNVLLCDICNGEHHIYCLNPPLSQFPIGNWFCPTCVPHQHDNKGKGLERILKFVDKNCEESVTFLDLVSDLKEKEYWEIDADKKTFLLKFLCDEILKTGFIRTNLKESFPKLSLRNEFLGTDSDNRFYWGLPNTSKHHGIIVHETGMCDSGAWRVFQSDEQIKNIITYLKRNNPTRRQLRNSILNWQKSISKNGQQTGVNVVEGETVFSHNGLATKASELIEAKYNREADSMKKGIRRKKMGKWFRCECLEPVLPFRYHCVNCHETFFTNLEFQQHNNKSHCGGVDHGQTSMSCDELRELKINLLDMEAALPDGAKRGSRESSEWRSEWCAFVKSANTIYEMVEANIVLESMIKTEYINNTWWWYWSSMAAAAKTSTISALSVRIYTLDAAIDYQKTTTATTTTTASGEKQSKKRKHPADKVKQQRKKPKKPEDKQETSEQVQNIIS